MPTDDASYAFIMDGRVKPGHDENELISEPNHYTPAPAVKFYPAAVCGLTTAT
jgi:hypothetical protein